MINYYMFTNEELEKSINEKIEKISKLSKGKESDIYVILFIQDKIIKMQSILLRRIKYKTE